MTGEWSTTIRRASYALLLVLAFQFINGMALADTSMSTTGSVSPAYTGQSSPWAINTDLVVGYAAPGAMTVAEAWDVTVAGEVFVGNPELDTATGTLTITGTGSTMSVDPEGESMLFVGPNARGDLTVTDSGFLMSHDALIGGSPVMNESDEVVDVVAGEGHATVSEGGQWDASWVTVGGIGSGSLTIQDTGSLVISDVGEVGLFSNTVGNVIVEDSGSWSTTDDLIVGIWGDGTMEVRSGGQVQSGRGWIGGVNPELMEYDSDPVFAEMGNPDGSGEVLVTGANSQWDAGDYLVVGAWGTGTLDIEAGGTVTAPEVYIGGMQFGLGEGGVFDPALVPTGTGTVTVTGNGSLLDVTSDDTLYVGYTSTGTLDVLAGGDVIAGSVVIGAGPDGDGTVVVAGSGSTLTAEDIQVGAWGTGEMDISNEGAVTTNYLSIGGIDVTDPTGLPQVVLDAFGDGDGTGTVTVSDAGSLTVNGPVYVGHYGEGTLNILSEAEVTTETTLIGATADSVGHVNVNDTPGTWTNTGSVFVGASGEGDLNVSDNGHVVVGEKLYIGGYETEDLPESVRGEAGDGDGTGAVTVEDVGSLVEATGIDVGVEGEGTLEILNGAEVQAETVVVGSGANGVGQIVVDGQVGEQRSTLRIESSLFRVVPAALGEGDVTIQNGGQVLVDGEGFLVVPDKIGVGAEGEGLMTISDGGFVRANSLDIGGVDPGFDSMEEYFDPEAEFADGTGTVTVTGAGSSLVVQDTLVGFSGDGTLNIDNGASVTSDSAFLGALPDATGTVVVSGASNWEAGDNVVVGLWGTGDLTISGGSQVSTRDFYVGGTDWNLVAGEASYDPDFAPDGTGTVLVTGDDSLLDVTSEETLYVGYAGEGTLRVESGGDVNTGSVVLGAGPDAQGTMVVTGDGSTLTTEDIQVAAWGTGNLTISDGAAATTNYLAIGGIDPSDTGLPQDVLDEFGSAEGTGTVTVTGAGSTLETETFLVGVTGEGTMQVADGGQVTAELGIVGLGEGSTGTLTVTGEDSTLTLESVIEGGPGYGVLAVGGWGNGTATISDGGVVDASVAYIGGFNEDELTDREGNGSDWGDGVPAGTGTMTVIGEGSGLNVGNDLMVGYAGTGTLTASEGGAIDAHTLIVGGGPEATGTVTIDDSQLDVIGDAIVGAWGDGNLTVSSGGQASIGTLVIGGFDSGDAPEELVETFGDPAGTGTVTVTGADSLLDVSEHFTIYVGYSGDGTMEVLNGGRVDSHASFVGYLEGSTGLVTVDGTDSLWMITGGASDIEPTAAGDGEVVVSNGGEIIVTDGNGGLDVAGNITVGSEGSGSEFSVFDGSDVYSDGLIVGGYDPGFETLGEYFDAELSEGSGAVTIADDGSVWDAGYVMVGLAGEGTLDIVDGGELLDDFAWIGVAPGSVGEVTLDTESQWVSSDEIAVGIWGSGTLDILGGSRVYASDVYIGGVPWEGLGNEYTADMAPNGTGVVNVSGDGSRLYATELNSMYIGYLGDGTLNITNGGYVESNTAGVAVLPGSVGSVTVSGGVVGEGGTVPSTWQNNVSMFIGGYGVGEMTIEEGGLVDIQNALYIGGFNPSEFLAVTLEDYDPNGTGTVTVTDEDSQLDASVLLAGTTGDGTLEVLNGGTANSEVGLVAFGPDSTGEVTVDGEGSTWTLSYLNQEQEDWSILGVGVYGTGSLTISDGGQVTVADAVIGGFDLEDIGAEAFADLWGDPVGDGTVLVTGAGSRLDVGYDLCIGHTGTGEMTIASGGRVTSRNGYIGDYSDATGTVLVTGSQGEMDSRWTIAENLYVAYDGTGSLTVNDGAYVTTGEDVVIADGPTGVGTVTVSGEGSRINASDQLFVGKDGTGSLLISDGGVVEVDHDTFVAFTTSSAGTVEVTGEDSRLYAREDLFVGGGYSENGDGGDGSLFVNDGADVIVGNELYVLENGLVGGDGTIDVQQATTLHNYGTIAPGNEGIGTLTVNGSVVFHEGSTFAVEINNDDEADKLEVNGNVTIDGGTVQVASEGTILGTHEYEIIHANAVEGEFADLDTALLDFSISAIDLDYNDVSVLLHIEAANFNDPNVAQTYNQRQVAGALQDIGEEGGNDVTQAVQGIDTASGVRHAYNQLSGQTRPTLAPMTMAGTSKFLGTVTSRVQTVKTGLVAGAFDSKLMAAAGPDQAIGGSTGPVGQTFAVGNGSAVMPERRWGLWGRGYGIFGDREAGSTMPGYNYDIYGGTFGVDYQFTQNMLAGLVGGLSEGDVNFDSSQDTTKFGAAHIGLYSSVAFEHLNVDAVVTYANVDYETKRYVTVLNEQLLGNFDGSELAAYVEASRDFDLAPDLCLSPLASVQYTYLELDSYTETGGTSALMFDKQDQESIRGSLGARLTKRLIETAGDFRADLQVRGRWVHEFGDARASVDTSFASNPTVVFTVKDDEISRDSAVLGTGFLAELSKQTRLYLDYDARLNSDETVHVLSASLQHRW